LCQFFVGCRSGLWGLGHRIETCGVCCCLPCRGQNLRALLTIRRGDPGMPLNRLNRRKFLKESAVAGAGMAIAGAVAAPGAQAAELAAARKPARRYSLTVMGTTDLHGHVFNWDYFKDAEYSDKAGNAQGL